MSRAGATPSSCNLGLFGSEASAREWQEVTRDPSYRSVWLSPDAILTDDLRSALRTLEQRPLTHAALLGIGGGHVEEAVVREVERASGVPGELRCLLVDQNRWLLQEAAERFRRPTARPCHANFERELAAVLDTARDGRQGDGSALLITLLGVTFANLDDGDGPFVASLARCLLPGDAIVIDVPVKRPRWSFEGDPRSRIAAYPPEQKRFFATPVAEQLAIPVEEVLARFDERIVAIQCRDSSVPGTDTVRILDRESGVVVENFRRYDFPQLVDWLAARRPLRVIHAEQPTRAANGPLAVAFIVLGAG